MPTVQPGKTAKVLVTGANGFIAVWVVKSLLEKGYSVRGTVRSLDKANHLKKLFAEHGDRLEFVQVEDITKEGAFDEAVKGVDAIEHTASPFHMHADDPQELIQPAVNGTVGILKSALKHGSTIQRVVVTSSCVAIFSPKATPQVCTESDWNEASIREVERDGKAAAGMSKYRASKTLAEKAAWEFYNANKSNISWDLVVLNPPYVFGPIIHQVTTPSSLNTSAFDFYTSVVSPNMGGKSAEAIHTGSCWIDVRDLGEAHALALVKEEAANERIIISAGPFVWQDFINTANKLSPSPIPSHKLPKGYPDHKRGEYLVNYNTAKEARIFGLKKKSMEEMVRDMLADFEARGW